MIFYNYEGYFGKQRKQEETEDQDDKPVRPATTRTFNYQKWQWHLMVDKLVKELNMKPEEVFGMNWISALNWLSMYKEKDDIQREQKKKSKQWQQ